MFSIEHPAQCHMFSIVELQKFTVIGYAKLSQSVGFWHFLAHSPSPNRNAQWRSISESFPFIAHWEHVTETTYYAHKYFQIFPIQIFPTQIFPNIWLLQTCFFELWGPSRATPLLQLPATTRQAKLHSALGLSRPSTNFKRKVSKPAKCTVLPSVQFCQVYSLPSVQFAKWQWAAETV